MTAGPSPACPKSISRGRPDIASRSPSDYLWDAEAGVSNPALPCEGRDTQIVRPARFRLGVVAVVLAVLALALVLGLTAPREDVGPDEGPRGNFGVKPSVDLLADATVDEGSPLTPEGVPEGAGEGNPGGDSPGGGADPDDELEGDGVSNDRGQQAAAADEDWYAIREGFGDAGTGDKQDLDQDRDGSDEHPDPAP